MGWPVTPEGLGTMLGMLDEYGVQAIYITENGAAFPDTIQEGGMSSRATDSDTVSGLWFVVCGLWFVVCGLWFVVSAINYLVAAR